MARVHLVGIGGSGMQPLAELLLKKGYTVSGSDRLILDPSQLDPISPPIRRRMERLKQFGAVLYPQDGSGLSDSTDQVVVSTAIEDDNPDVIAANQYNIPILHRSEELRNQVHEDHLLAVAGTSGKSTTAALCGWILKSLAQLDCFAGGAEILDGSEWSAVHVGSGNWSCLELDESDKSILRFHPQHALILNITRDHHTYEENLEIFHQFARQTKGAILLNKTDEGCIHLGRQFGESTKLCWFEPPQKDIIRFSQDGIQFRWNHTEWSSSLLGLHNAENITAAVSLIMNALPDADILQIKKAVQTFPGIRRRLQRYGTNTPAVYDDYAHNPEKIKALFQCLQQHYGRACLIFQPHGYTPLRFHLNGIADVCAEVMQKNDCLILLPVYDAGGTTKRDVSSHDLMREITGKNVKVIEQRNDVTQYLQSNKHLFDAIAVAGARDDTLAQFAARIAQALT